MSNDNLFHRVLYPIFTSKNTLVLNNEEIVTFTLFIPSEIPYLCGDNDPYNDKLSLRTCKP